MSIDVSILIRCDDDFDSIVLKLEGVLGKPAIPREGNVDFSLLGIQFTVHEMEWVDEKGLPLSRYPVSVTFWKRRPMPAPGNELEFRKMMALAVAQDLSDVLPGGELLVIENSQVFLARLGGT